MKLVAFVALVAAAAVLAAVYGALHDQISFTVAPEYFTLFKFRQFALSGVGEMPPRLGVAVVGILATWWVGLFAGVLIAGAGLFHRTAPAMVRSTLRAYGVLAVVAFAAGLVGLAYGWVIAGGAAAPHFAEWWRPEGLTAPRRFFAVGSMHNASYLGGAVGVLIAVTYQVRAARRATRAAQPLRPQPAACSAARATSASSHQRDSVP